MKQILTLVVLGCSITYIHAQNVGVNTSGALPHASTILDLNTGNAFTSPNGKGVLLPNVALTGRSDITTVTSPPNSLLVYNTATANTGSLAVVPGYYYFDGTTSMWVALLGSSNTNNWALLGNAGTLAGTNFLGTTDNVDLVFKTNNTEQVRVLSSGNVGIGTSAPNPSAIVEIMSTTQGVKFPSLTSAQRLSIGTPPAGLMVYDVTANILMSYNGARWQEVGGDPIGTIEAFHKNMSGTPVLPWGWVECNGQVLADPESPYNSQTIPDLNNTGKFIRGSTVSGAMQLEDIGAHTHAGTTTTNGSHNHSGSTGSVNSTNGRFLPWDDNLQTNKIDNTNPVQLTDTPIGGGVPPWDGLPTVGNFMSTIDQLDHTHAISTDGNHNHTFTTNANSGTETRPTNMSVVWIIRVK